MQQRTYWLTGASSGIGREIARQLAAVGHRVYLTARRQEALQEIAAEHPDKLIPLPADVSDSAAMQHVFSSLPPELQPDSLDGIILAAGICEYMDLPVIDAAAFRRVTDINYLGVVHACQAALPLLLEAAGQGRGRPQITGLCSMSTYLPFPRAEAYGAAKAAMEYFLRSLYSEVKPVMDVTLVYPGFIETPMTAGNDFPMPFTMQAQQAARLIVGSLHSGRRTLAFPRRLYWLLKFAAWIPGLWYGLLAGKMSRWKPAQQR